MSKILEALGKLDPSNDNHWTNDGLPRIDTVRMLAADPTITRETITAEAPNFSRQTVAAVQPPVTATTKTTESSKEEVVNYDKLISEAQEGVQEILRVRDEVQAELNKRQDKLDALINAKHAAGSGESNDDAIQSYLNSQKGVLTERARRAKVLKESGVTLADIQALIPQAAPIDQALAKKR